MNLRAMMTFVATLSLGCSEDAARESASAGATAVGSPPTTGRIRVAVILANGSSGTPDPSTVTQVESYLAPIRAFYTQASYGKAQVETKVFGWQPVSVDCNGDWTAWTSDI